MGTGIGQREYNGPVGSKGEAGQKGYPPSLPGLGVGYREYNEPEKPASLRSLSAQRAWIIRRNRPAPVSHSDVEKAKAAIEKTRQRIFAYNDDEWELQKRVGEEGRSRHLAGRLTRISNLKEGAARKMEEQSQRHAVLANAHSDWHNVLPMLDAQISQERDRRKGTAR